MCLVQSERVLPLIFSAQMVFINFFILSQRNNRLPTFILIMPYKGRVHHAVVTQLHPNSNSVSVEWMERNETKGKEIELEALYALNASLFVILSFFKAYCLICD